MPRIRIPRISTFSSLFFPLPLLPLVTLPPEFRPRSRCSLDENARSEHRSLKRNWILDACTLSNSSLTFLRGEGIYLRIRRVVRFFWFSVLRLHSPFDSFLDHSNRTSFSPDYTLQFFSSQLQSLRLSFFDRVPFQFHFPSLPRLHLPRFQSLFDYTPCDYLPLPSITTLLDYTPSDYTLSFSLSHSIHSFDRDGCRMATVTNRKCKIARSYERKGENLWTAGDPRHLFPSSH